MLCGGRAHAGKKAKVAWSSPLAKVWRATRGTRSPRLSIIPSRTGETISRGQLSISMIKLLHWGSADGLPLFGGRSLSLAFTSVGWENTGQISSSMEILSLTTISQGRDFKIFIIFLQLCRAKTKNNFKK